MSAQRTRPDAASTRACDGLHVYIHRLPPLSRATGYNTSRRTFGVDVPCVPCGWVKETLEFGDNCGHECVADDGHGGRPIGTTQALSAGMMQKIHFADGAPLWEAPSHLLEHIIISRIARSCQVHDPLQADLFLVPYLPGLVLGAASGGFGTGRFSHAQAVSYVKEMKAALQKTPSWRRHSGSDHILVLGRSLSDFAPSKAAGRSILVSCDHAVLSEWPSPIQHIRRAVSDFATTADIF